MAFWQAEDGSLIYFEVHGKQGDKGALLLLPGLLGSTAGHWQNFITPLADDYLVLLADWRGHGRSENKQLDLLPEQIVQDLAGLLDHIGVAGVHLAGYDLGGYLGLMLKLRHSHRVLSLQMLATKFYWESTAVSSVREQLDPDLIVKNSPNYATHLAEEHGAARWRQLVRQAGDLIAYLGENGITEQMLKTVKGPVMVAVGDRDELVPVQEAFVLSRALPEASLFVIPQGRHPFQSINRNPLLAVMRDFHQ